LATSRICVLAAAASVAGCASAAGMALQVGRDLLLDVAGHNYSSEYEQKLDKLIESLNGAAPRIAAAAESGAHAAGAALDQAVADGQAAVDRAVGAVAAASAAIEPTGAPLSVDVTVLRETQLDGRWTAQAIADGEVLRDGVGRTDPGDNLKIRIGVPETCYVYAVWIDATAWAVPVFPDGPGLVRDEPLTRGSTVELPTGTDWFYLDDRRGVETLYVLVSRAPRPDVATQLGALSGQHRPQLPASAAAESVTAPYAITRGLAGQRPGRAEAVQTSDGSTQQAAGQSFFGPPDGGELVITRWFRHE